VLEALLMSIISIIILVTVALLGHETFPDDPLLIMQVVFGLWLFGIGYGLAASVLMELVPEMEHVLKIVMMPLYLISGVIFPLARIPEPYRDILMINPIAHALEFVRLGFFPYYHTVPGISLAYLYAWAVVSVFVGLVLYRRFAVQLVMR
jgi:capsular polysaccharide transport system permease protein